MLACIPILLLAVTVVALPESVSEFPARSALHSILARRVAQQCAPNQRLVCCNKTDDCAELDMSKIDISDFLQEHCTATVACCDLGGNELNTSRNWGDIAQSCNHIDNLSITTTPTVPLSPTNSKPTRLDAASSVNSFLPSKQSNVAITATEVEVVNRYTTYCPLVATANAGSKTYTASTHLWSRPTHEAGPGFTLVKATNSSQSSPVKPTSVVTAGVENQSIGYGFALAAAVAAAFAL